MSDVTQQIKEKLDIADFIKSYIQLLPAGKNFKANCPFHKEKTPSFMVSPDRQSWHCFGGCNDGGDIFSFLMKYENLEFYEALQVLAEKAGIDLKKDGYSGSSQKQFSVLYEINAAAKDFFQKNLTAAALNYYLSRGLKKETIEEFELGFASPASDQLLRYLLNLGFSAYDVEKAGLTFRTDRGTYWDRFRSRLMFPIYNSFAKVIGFTGRLLPKPSESASSAEKEGEGGLALAKYVNSPETPIFQKSKTLYGLHKSKEAIRDSQSVILVEGQMDFLMTYQSGIKNVAASSGTALTNDQLKLLKRLAGQLILSFDSDEAGQNAIERSIDLALASDFSVKILSLPEKDPADIAKQNPELLKKIVNDTKSARDFYFDRYLKTGLDDYESKRRLRIILAKVKNLYSPIDQADWLKKLAEKTGIDEKSLSGEMEKMKTTEKSWTSQAHNLPNVQNLSRKQLIAFRILDLGGSKDILANYAPEVLRESVSPLSVLKASFENSQLIKDDAKDELQELIRQLKIEFHKEKASLLKLAIAKAEKDGGAQALSAALKEFDNNSRDLHNIIHYGEKTSSGEKSELYQKNKETDQEKNES